MPIINDRANPLVESQRAHKEGRGRRWPESGVPDNPGAWLMAVAKRRAIDLIRRGKLLERKHGEVGRELEARQESVATRLDDAIDDDVGDDLLRLMFTACHPVLSREARVALTLRLLGGLTTEEIARAFLVPEPTVAQRIVRAKRSLAEARVPFEVPRGAELAARLSSVLEVIYLVFNEGYSATAGDDWIRPALCDDALRLARILAELAPKEPEVHGLVALMEIQASRSGARVGPYGEPVLLLDQDRARWDPLLIRRGLAALERAEAAGGALGPYALQAAIAACHARARTPAETDWARIAALYDALVQLAPSPVVELNRAVAVAMAFGPAAGLELVDALTSEPSLKGYHLLPSVRGDLLAKLGRFEEASTEFERAASLTRNARARCSSSAPPRAPGSGNDADPNLQLQGGFMNGSGLVSHWRSWSPYLLSVLRIIAAFLFMQIGTAKLFAFPGAVMPGGGTAPVGSLAGIAGILETFGGLLLLVGLFTRPVAFLLSGQMAVAYFYAHAPHGFWPVLNQGEPAVHYAFLWLYLSSAGAGPWSLDALRRRASERIP